MQCAFNTSNVLMISSFSSFSVVFLFVFFVLCVLCHCVIVYCHAGEERLIKTDVYFCFDFKWT